MAHRTSEVTVLSSQMYLSVDTALICGEKCWILIRCPFVSVLKEMRFLIRIHETAMLVKTALM
jgi:hypothetical protein